MIRKLLPLAFVITVIYSCKKDSVNPDMGEKDNITFKIYENRFLDDLWKLNPDWATREGYHKYDSLLLMPDSKHRDAIINFTRKHLDSLSAYNATQLNDANKIDHHLIQNQLEKMQWEVQQERAYEWNPTTYNVIGSFAYILNEHYAPLQDRLRHFYQKMENLPEYYKVAEKQIKNPAPELLNLAVNQLNGGVSVIEKDFADSLKKTKIPAEEQKQMLTRAELSAKTIKDFAAWLKALKNDKPRSFRLGKQLYDDKFKYDIQSAGSAQQLFNSAMDRSKYLHKAMANIAIKLWPKYFGTTPMPADTLAIVRAMIDTLSSKHVQPGEFQSAIEKQIPQLVSFINTKNLLTLDPSKPLIVRKEPDYMAGVAGASVSSPGPYDKTGNTYFNVGSLAGWPAEKAESYLREYNQYTLQILCIHEAIPGHYTQLVYANKAPSIIKSVLGNGAMIEGWAVYSEQMMLEAGYGNNEPEMWLMWDKWNLRSVTNTILDYAVHTGKVEKDAEVKFLVNNAFQQQAEAEGKWNRVTVSSVQLTSYYAGYKEIIDLRNDYKKMMGDKYSVKEFNEKFLSFGSVPVKYIREIMLAKPKMDEKK